MFLDKRFVPGREYTIHFEDDCIQGQLKLTFKYYVVYDTDDRDPLWKRPTICVDYQMLPVDIDNRVMFGQAVFEEGFLEPDWGSWGVKDDV